MSGDRWAVEKTAKRSNSHPWDGFVTGPENALAHASILALARGEAEGVSPLVIHGPSGVGKSRLLSALVGERLMRNPSASIAYLEAETFAASCAEAAGKSGGWAELRGWFRTLDLFILEDMHALNRAPLALAELAHTLDALEEAGAGVAVSAREGPGQWRNWPPRLVNRLVGGLSVRVDPPTLASRRRYLLDRARSQKVTLSAEAVDTLAESAEGYRTLDGWLARLVLIARVERKSIEKTLAASVLTEDGIAVAGDAGRPQASSISEVAHAVSERFRVTLRDLRSDSRRTVLTGPRHIAMYLARSVTGLSFQAIGDYFGGRDPATVRHACKAAGARIDADPALAAAVAAIQRRWRKVEPPDE